MAAPIIISKRNFGGLQSLPQLSQGERELNADITAANQEASARINAVQRETAAEIGAGRAITDQAMRGSEAFTKFAGQVNQFTQQLSNQVLEAVQTTQVNEAQAKRQRLRSEAFSAFEQDPDWKGAPDRLRQKFTEIDNDAFQGFGASQISAMKAQTLRADLSMERQLNTRSFGKMVNAAQAADQESQVLSLNNASRATSGPEREGQILERDRQVDDLVAKGIYDATQGVALKQGFRQQLDQADIYKGIKNTPAETIKALDDPKMFTSLSPTQRETAKAQAQAAIAERQNNEAGVAVQRDKVAALATYGIVLSPDDVGRAGAVYDRIVAQESGGRADAKSVQGALGVGQLMPGTARQMANEAGIPEKDLPESEFRERLLTDPALNRRLGFAYFQKGLRLSQGSLPAAIAGYHMGQERAAGIHRQAIATFGEGYSAEQFISLIPADLKDGSGKHTRDYVADIYQRMGARVDRGGVTGNAVYQVARTVESGAATLDNRELQQIQKVVSLTQDSRDAVTEAFKGGYATDPAMVAAAKAPLIAAANAGDTSAIVKLREFGQLEQIAPVVRQAYQLSPAQLEAGIAEMRVAVANGSAGAVGQQRLKVFEAVQTEVAKQAHENPVGLIERSGRAVVSPVQPDAAPAQIGQQLQMRAPAANEALRIYDGSFKVLKPQEADALKQRWSQAQEPERLDLIRAFHDGTGGGKAYDALIKQIGVDAVSATAGRIAAVDSEMARSVIRGKALLDQKGVDDGKTSELKTALKNTLGRSTYPANVQSELIDAALARYVDQRSGVGALYDATDPRALETAIEDVTGRMATINGAKVPAPRGVAPGRMQSAWAATTLADLGGKLIGQNGQPLDLEFVKGQGVLIPFGYSTGKYLVATPGPAGQDPRGVRGADGRNIVLDINPVLRRLQSVFPPETDMRMLPAGTPGATGVLPLDPLGGMGGGPRLVDKPMVMP